MRETFETAKAIIYLVTCCIGGIFGGIFIGALYCIIMNLLFGNIEGAKNIINSFI